MATRIKLRRDTAANWAANNPILALGEPGFDTTNNKLKVGDGVNHWEQLSYLTDDTGVITPRTAVGSFLLHGPVPNNTQPNGADWWFESVTTDPDGNGYFVGGWFEYDTYHGWSHVVKVNVEGDIEWQKEITWADAWEGAGVSAVYNTATDQLVVLGQYYLADTPLGQNANTAVVFNLDAGTGDFVGDAITIRDDVIEDGSEYSYVDPYDIDLTASGDPIVVGTKEGNLQVFNLTTQTGSTTDWLYVDASVFPEGAYPVEYNGWYITGTNYNSRVYIQSVNQYNNAPTYNLTGGTGTDVVLSIDADGSGGYTISGASGGTGYVEHNKILVLGSNLGGVDGVNDATVTIDSVDGGAVVSASVSGTSTGSGTYAPVSGTNIPGGYNFLLNTNWRMRGSEIYYPSYADHSGFWIQQVGSDYAVGDTVYVNPADYGGLTSATVTITAVGGSGEVQDFSISATYNTGTVKLYGGGYGVDFGTEGSWQAWHMDQQAYIWTPAWQRLYGDTSWDKAQAVATDSNGNIYVAGNSYDLTVNGGETRGVLIKVSSTGDLLWSKNFDPIDFNDFDDGYTGVAVDGEDNIIIVHDEVVTKLDGTGTVLWQHWIQPNSPFGMWNSCVDVDSDNNIYVAAEYDYLGQNTGDDYLVIKFDTDGNVLWQREAGTTADEDSQWNNSYQMLAVGGNRFYLAGNSYQGNNDVGFGTNFPTDGTGASDTHHGRFLYRETTWDITTSTAAVQDMPTFWTGTTFLSVATTSTFAGSTTSTSNTELIIRTGDTDGRIENLYSISFEDGTVQTTAYVPGIPQGPDSPRNYNTNDFVLSLEDAGTMTRWYAEGWGWASVDIYVPTNDQVPFPIGTQVHFMKDNGFEALMFWPGIYGNGYNDVMIMPASPADYKTGSMYNWGEGWSVRHPDWINVPCIATLTKVDTNKWLLSCNSPTHIMDWSW